MNVCKECNREYEYKRNRGMTLRFCATCTIRKYRRNRKKVLVDLKGGKCEICGYKKSLNALHFHHLDPTNKEFGLGSGRIHNLEQEITEINKCILICANCHAEAHDTTG